MQHLDEAAQFIIEVSKDYSFLTFSGEMGVGKTTLIKALVAALGSNDLVTSPTFSLVNEYALEGSKREMVYHFDFYRIDNLEEVYDIGYEAYFYSDQYCFIEWPDKIASLLPEHYVEIQISRDVLDENNREITIFKH
ncbi:MAG: tRNA (adenosine(37)-N6)-threonylcarbamoyltransferase complex ATPase subunit type 1 TsaE [Flavobacteriales bacterium]|nr:tRNA (adenosine(37)-N6)-threonylcarbamoyltransferase complex ATPase subunit type 1 TsaE [Flavobacteriales bacterium]